MAIGAVMAVAGAAELAMGRPPICRCGQVRPWAGAVHSPESSQQVADWYSLSHLVHGLLFFAAGWALLRRFTVGTRLLVATVLEAGWELLENSPVVIDRYRAATIADGYAGDSVLNSMSDIGFMLIGFALAARLPVRASILLGLAFELAALAAIRDNLTLNVLMLVHPIAAVRAWQGGA